MNQHEKEATSTKKESTASDPLYGALPRSLGGTKVDRAGPVDLSRALPVQSSIRPSAETLNDAIVHKGISLSKGIQRKPGTSTGDPTQRRSINDEKNRRQRANVPGIRHNPRRKRGGGGGRRLVLGKDEQYFSLYEPLRRLWLEYARSLHAQDGGGGFAAKVLKMDLHGAPVRVDRANDPSLVGIQGILIAETANTVLVATKQDKVVTVPKNITVLHVLLDNLQIELYLPALAFRASERSARKIKKRHMPYI